jgi:solute:Na+ symporter, SSS family
LHSESLPVQVLFFGALISAIVSTASGAVLAPAAILSNNLILPMLGSLPDSRLLALSRLSVLLVALISLSLALLKSNIYELVGESSALSLVSLFIPLVMGLYSRRATATAAILSMLLGIGAWLLALFLETTINPLVYGLAGSIAGMLTCFLQTSAPQQKFQQPVRQAYRKAT